MKKIFLLVVSLCVYQSSQAQKECRLKFGAVPQFEQRKLLKIWSPITHKLSEKLKCQVEIVGSKNIQIFEQNFQQGLYDIAYMNPYHAIMANKRQGYIPVIRSGAKMLKGILVVQKSSSINDIQELEGQTLAFPSPNALGASLLMRAEIAEKQQVNITPRYVKTHSSVYLHVAKGLLPAGGGVLRTLKQQPPAIQEKLRILYTTTPVPSHPVAVHPRLKKERQKEIQKAFLQISEDHASLFAPIPMLEPRSTSLSDYEPLKKMNLEKYQGH